jgi:uncharacterized protein (DUF2236 family)
MAKTILPTAEEAPALVPGPGSVTWRVVGDARLLVAAGYALVLQVAHPVVGAGVDQHSDFRSDPWGRLMRTLDYVNVTIFGGPEAALEMGRRTRERHRAIKGTLPDGGRYHSLQPEAFAWVHATLGHAILRAADRFGARPSDAERDVFYAEWRGLGRLVGVRDRDLPEDFDGFSAYVEEMMRSTLEDTTAVRTVLDTLSRPAAPPIPLLTDPAWRVLRLPAARAMRLATVGLLPDFLRRRLGVSWSRADEAQLVALSAASRATTPLLAVSAPLRAFGPSYLRWRRPEIARTGIPL